MSKINNQNWSATRINTGTKVMNISEKYEKAFNYFKREYAYKMGGTQTVILPNGMKKHFDDRKYYSGRGAKYNASIRHDHIGEVKVSRKDYSEFLNFLKKREEAFSAMKAKKSAERKRYNDFAAKEKYEVDGGFIVLSDEEKHSKSYDPERLAATLDISIEDARLLQSTGKTYVFATQKHSGKVVELYHPSLDCNDLSISFTFVTKERLAEFMNNRDEWTSAPYARLVGQSEKENHFVC